MCPSLRTGLYLTSDGEYLKSGPKFAVTYMYRHVYEDGAKLSLSKLTVTPLYKDRVGKYLPA